MLRWSLQCELRSENDPLEVDSAPLVQLGAFRLDFLAKTADNAETPSFKSVTVRVSRRCVSTLIVALRPKSVFHFYGFASTKPTHVESGSVVFLQPLLTTKPELAACLLT